MVNGMPSVNIEMTTIDLLLTVYQLEKVFYSTPARLVYAEGGAAFACGQCYKQDGKLFVCKDGEKLVLVYVGQDGNALLTPAVDTIMDTNGYIQLKSREARVVFERTENFEEASMAMVSWRSNYEEILYKLKVIEEVLEECEKMSKDGNGNGTNEQE